MASRYREQAVREKGSDGQLLRAGFLWSEYRQGVVTLLIASWCFGPMFAIMFLFASWPQAALVCVTGIIASQVYWRRKGLRSAGVIFEASGTIATPYGFPDFRNRKAINGHWDQTQSIEHEHGRDGRWRVLLHTKSGNIIYLADLGDRETAQKVSVQLNLALAEMRKAALEAARRQPPRETLRPSRRVIS